MTKQANSRHCFVCGVKNPYGLHMSFYETGPGEVAAEYTVPEQFQGYPGVVHGGIIAAMMDEVTGRVFMDGDPPCFMVTASLSIRYRKPVPVGKTLRMTGKVKENKGRVCAAIGEMRDENGQLLVEAEATLAELPPGMWKDANVEPEDWMVYPDEEPDEEIQA